MHSVTISDYLQTLSPVILDKIYQQTSSCLAIFRLLPSLAQQYVLRLLYLNDAQIPSQMIDLWTNTDSDEKQKNLLESLQRLKKLSILIEKSSHFHLNATFSLQFKNYLLKPNQKELKIIKGKEMDISILESYALQCWENCLHFMVGNQISGFNLSDSALELLCASQLMRKTGKSKKNLSITHKGFQFLLQDINTQIWFLLLQYLEMAEQLELEMVEVLNFFFLLGNLELGSAYPLEALNQTQIALIKDLKDFGLIYIERDVFYPTRLATTLTSSSATISTKQEFIFVETNYRVYAYTNSPLQISVLALFVQLKTRFENLVVGLITRDSIKNALSKGITSAQITHYLTVHAHPDTKSQAHILPPTVVDQINLWEMERNRLNFTSGFFYHDFASSREFEASLEYAKSLNCVSWFHREKRYLFIQPEGHEIVKSFVKSLIHGQQ